MAKCHEMATSQENTDKVRVKTTRPVSKSVFTQSTVSLGNSCDRLTLFGRFNLQSLPLSSVDSLQRSHKQCLHRHSCINVSLLLLSVLVQWASTHYSANHSVDRLSWFLCDSLVSLLVHIITTVCTHEMSALLNAASHLRCFQLSCLRCSLSDDSHFIPVTFSHCQ